MSSRSVSVLGQDPSGKFFTEKRKDSGGKKPGKDWKGGNEGRKEGNGEERGRKYLHENENKEIEGGNETLVIETLFKDFKNLIKTYLSPAVKVVIPLSGDVEHLIIVEMRLLLLTNPASGYYDRSSKASIHLHLPVLSLHPHDLHLPLPCLVSLHRQYLHFLVPSRVSLHHLCLQLQVPDHACLNLLDQFRASYPIPVLYHSPSKNSRYLNGQKIRMEKFNSMYN